MPSGRPHASWSRKVESYLKDAGMKGLASAWAMARWRLKEFARFTINSTVYARFYDGDIRFSVSFDCSIPPKMATSIPNEYSKCYISTTINPRDSKFGRFKEDNE